MSLSIGQQAPDFQLPDTEKQMHALSSYKGKNVVLLFFPAAFTSTCTQEMCQTRDELSFYNDMDAVIFGISVDMHYSLHKYKSEHNINFSLLSDFNKEAINAYGCKYEVFGPGYKGVAKRASFVIDKDGVIRFAEVQENATPLPDFAGIKKVLEGLK